MSISDYYFDEINSVDYFRELAEQEPNIPEDDDE
tara:strand:+ start:119 stop:220 length:102 start_codon:yes stop_codon:yes gene_type:complete